MPKAKSKKPTVKLTGGAVNGHVISAKIPATLTGTKIAFPHRHLAVIETGVDVVVPDGYRLRFALVPELWGRGMVATNTAPVVAGPVRVAVLNSGREIVEVKDGDPLVAFWLEADVDFETEVQ
jgi:hypothetical protein